MSDKNLLPERSGSELKRRGNSPQYRRILRVKLDDDKTGTEMGECDPEKRRMIHHLSLTFQTTADKSFYSHIRISDTSP